MATSNAPRTRKNIRTTQETINRPWTNPNHAEAPSFSNRSRIRDIQRRLRLEASRAKKPVEEQIHEQRRQKEARLPADKKREYERELIERLRDEATREAEKKRSLVMRRYKKVKFIETRKSDRRWKAAQKALKESENEKEKKRLQEALHVAEVDKNYVKYCPLGWTYVSLYAGENNEDAEADERREKGDPAMWKRVEQAMEEKGALDRLKNELVITMRLADEVKVEETAQEGDNDSDGDFFE